MDRPADWLALVNEPIGVPDLEELRSGVNRGQPYGSDPWTRRIAKRLGLESSLRNPWRTTKQEKSRTAATPRRLRVPR